MTPNTDNTQDPQNPASIIVTILTILFCLAIFLYFIRTYTKLVIVKKLNWDDRVSSNLYILNSP